MAATQNVDPRPDPAIVEALELLGVSHLLLAVHDASFPCASGEESGRGSPYGAGGLTLARFARSLGFTGLQLGPQGQTSPVNPSPYDGALFSRNILSLDLKTLVEQGLLSRSGWEALLAGNPSPDGRRVPYVHSLQAYHRVMCDVHLNFLVARTRGEEEAISLDREMGELRASTRWLRDDALYEALSLEHGDLPWWQWPATGEASLDRWLCAPPPGQEAACAIHRRRLETSHHHLLEHYDLAQVLLLRQHRAFRKRMAALGLKIYGDAQVGFSLRDTWSLRSLLLDNYFMGAPPSRTNREGQPWSYQVLDPARYLDGRGGPGPVLHFIAERLGKMLAEFDGLRLDHPHGLVCPWVYRADDPDPFRAVQGGARLFASPDLPDHPDLAPFSIAAPGQLNRNHSRHADDWVAELTPRQEERYALIMDTLMEQVRLHGRSGEDILCEVLSTEPLPLRLVRLRHGLGRFRVTQKADLDDPEDVYRSENALPQDWVMVGNHDTPPIWALTKEWQGHEMGGRQAEYLARRLHPENPERLAQTLADDPRRLAHAKMADLFLSPARHVMIFFADLFGLEETYNVPGTRNEENWTLRVPPDFARRYEEGKGRGEVFNLRAALALALKARPDTARPELITRLESEGGWTID